MADIESAAVVRFEHPGAGRRRARSTPKGRQVLPHAHHEIAVLLGDRPRDRQYLIEYLHLVQDRYHQLSAAHLAALADELRLAFAEVFETATFYAHFDVVKEGEPDLAPLVVRVCDSVTCAMFGAERLLGELRGAEAGGTLGAGVRVVRAPCVGLCDRAPVVEVGHHFLHEADLGAVQKAIAAGDTHPHMPDDTVGYDAYVAAGGYALLGGLQSGAVSAEAVLQALDDSGLRGMGGAGFPAGRKWRSVRSEPGPRLMAVNADEGEPGTFKDRHYLNSDPHRFLEGMLVAALVVEAADIYLYLRDEYPVARAILAREIGRLPAGLPRIHVRRGAGAYICGEESSMLESIEGKRGLPRHKPPYPFQVGAVRAADADQQCGDALLGAGCGGAWGGVVDGAWAAWAGGTAELFGEWAGAGAGGEAGAGGDHGCGVDRGVLRGDGGGAGVPRLSAGGGFRGGYCRRRWRISRWISGRSRNTGVSSGRRRWWCFRRRMTFRGWR